MTEATTSHAVADAGPGRQLLDGRVVLVTGGSRGIGAATARLAGAHGAAVGVNYHTSRDRADAVVRDVEASGGRALAVPGDVADSAEVAAMATVLRTAYGPIDTIVLNATGHHQGFTPGELIARPAETELLVGEQLRAIIGPCAAVVSDMKRLGHGCVIIIGSGLSRAPYPGMGPLSIAKAAGDAAARVLAGELGPYGIRVNVVAPGFVATESSAAYVPERDQAALAARTPLGRVATPDDVAGAAVMLMAGHAGFVTGQRVDVTGGAS